ncbi:MAG: pentapeptide repeat-containing protein, partial [Acutalibacteraceae bacterium]
VIHDMTLEQDIQFALEHDEAIEYKQYENEILADIAIENIEFESVVLTNCKFMNCNFERVSFYHTQLNHCEFANCNFSEGYFKHVQWIDCKGDGADFSQSSFMNITIENGSYFCTNFTGNIMDDASIQNANMSNAFMPESKFKRFSVVNTNLEKVDFFKTSLKGIDVSTCNIAGITVSENFNEIKGIQIDALQAADIAQLVGVKIK